MRTGYKVLRREAHNKRNKQGKRKPGRPLGSRDKETLKRELKAERELLRAANFKFSTEHMDEQIGQLEQLVKLLYPFDASGAVIKGKSSQIYFRAFELFRDFLSMRAPYQSPRLASVQVVPAQNRKHTTVKVTLLDERGEKFFSDMPEDDDLKQIEHVPSDEEAA